MRISFVALLALALAAAPAAPAALCPCDQEGSAQVAAAACSCCDSTAGSCCCGPEDDGGAAQLKNGCVCSMHVPETLEPPVVQLPSPVAGAEARFAEPVHLAAVGAHWVFVVRGDPHPEVRLPLLL